MKKNPFKSQDVVLPAIKVSAGELGSLLSDPGFPLARPNCTTFLFVGHLV